MMFFLPESLTFLVKRDKGQARVRRIISHIAPAFLKDKDVEFCSTDVRRPGVPVKHLFLQGRATTTVLLWICFFIAFYLIALMNSWAPTLLKKSGASVQQYALAFALINLGSGIAPVSIGWLMDEARNPYRILQGGFVVGFLSLVAFGFFATSPFLVIASLSVLCGLFVNGTTSGLVALVTLSYPQDVTGTAVGWAYAIGRVGMTVAPLIGGMLIGLKLTVFEICGSNAIGALIIIGIIAILTAHTARIRKMESNVC
jgi:AAHS family 4-hydroxybenzoate transporter-like MFS transporter